MGVRVPLLAPALSTSGSAEAPTRTGSLALDADTGSLRWAGNPGGGRRVSAGAAEPVPARVVDARADAAQPRRRRGARSGGGVRDPAVGAPVRVGAPAASIVSGAARRAEPAGHPHPRAGELRR